MPYLQLEVIKHYDTATKQLLAKRMGEIYARIMMADVRRITVAIRELGEGNIWRCSAEDPAPGALLMLDIREGRSVAMRAELAKALVELCTTMLELDTYQLNVEFTQHSGDEMYHSRWGAFSDDWTPSEE